MTRFRREPVSAVEMVRLVDDLTGRIWRARHHEVAAARSRRGARLLLAWWRLGIEREAYTRGHMEAL